MALPTGMAAAGKSLQDSSPSAPIDLWGKALNHVNKDKKIALDGSLDGKREIVNDVLSLVRAAEQTCQQKRWKWKNRRGGSVILRDVFAKMVTWVQKFKDMGDIIVQYDPAHASIPWGVARFAIVSDFQANGAMLECLELVFNLITKFEIVECLYLRKPSSLAKQLEQSIISMYTSVLEYLFDAYKYYSKGTFSRVINNMFQLEETTLKHQAAIKIKAEGVDEYIHLLSHEIVLNGDVMLNGIVDTLGNLNMSLQKLQGAGNQAVPVQEPSRLDTETLSRLLTDLNEPIRRMASGLKLIDDKLNGEERMKVFDWLSSTQYSSHHRSKVKDLLPGSGEWLLRKPEFKEWLASSSSSILWLHGIPGSGKSMLVAHVIEFLRKQSSKQTCPTPIAYFYCARSANEPERSNPEELLGSILEQLSSSDPDLPIKLQVVDIYKKKKKEARGRRPEQLSLDETVETILDLVYDDPALILIDGLDECNPKRRSDLLDGLRRILRETENVVKIFVSSRDDHDLVHRLSSTPNLYIQAADNMEDIREFVRSRVDEAIRKEKILCGAVSENLRLGIINTLIDKANGMFRLASLHIERLCDPHHIKTASNVINTLSNLPSDLKHSYQAVMTSIAQSEEPTPKLAQRIMKWLLCAQEAPNSETFIFAICYDMPGSSTLTLQDILSICCNLVIYDDILKRFQFTHLSVLEYLEGLDTYSWSAVTTFAAETCITWLLTLNAESQVEKPVNGQESFGHHADKFWPVYAFEAGDQRRTGRLESLLQQFLYPSQADSVGSPQFTKWVDRGTFEIFCLSSPPNPLFAACYFSLDEILTVLLKDPGAFHAKNFIRLNCSEIAAQLNVGTTIRAIFKESRKHQIPLEYWGKALVIAARTCSIDPLKALLHEIGPNYVTKEHPKEIIRLIETRHHQESKCDEVLQLVLSNNANLLVTDDILDFALNEFEEHRLKILRPLFKHAYQGERNTVLHVSLKPDEEEYQFSAIVQGVDPIGTRRQDTAAVIVCHGDRSPTIMVRSPWDRGLDPNIINNSMGSTQPLSLETLVAEVRRNEVVAWSTDQVLTIMLVNAERGSLEISWEDIVMAKQMKRGRFCLFLLLQTRPKIGPVAIHMLISFWDELIIGAVLQYQSIKITKDIVRAAAGNFRSGVKIMERLLDQDSEHLGGS